MLPPQSKRCYGENSAIPWVLTEPRLTPYKERETRDEWGNSGVQAHASCVCVYWPDCVPALSFLLMLTIYSPSTIPPCLAVMRVWRMRLDGRDSYGDRSDVFGVREISIPADARNAFHYAILF